MKWSGTWGWRLFLVLSLTWGAWITVLYAKMVHDLSLPGIQALYASTKVFFLWQAAGFMLVSIFSIIRRPQWVGRITAGYLGLSTIVLLAFSREIWLPLTFALFLLWLFLAISSVRLALHRLAGPDQATWGLSCGVLYGALIPLSFFLSLFGLMARWPVTIVALVMIVPGGIYHVCSWRRGGRSLISWLDTLNLFGATALGASWIALALAFVGACAPEIESDSIRTHIPYMQQLVRDGGLTLQQLDFQRWMVYGTRTLFATGFVVGSMDAARWLSWFCSAALMILVSEEVARRSGQKNLGVLAGAAIVTTPMVLSLSRTLYHDHVIALLCVTAFISLFRSFDQGSRAGTMISSFVMGCAVQTKYNVLIFGIIWALFLVVFGVRKFRLPRGLKWCVYPLAVAALAGCPWYVHTWATVGNPVFPYLNEYFGSPYWPEGQTTSFDHSVYTFGESVSSKLLFPWLATFHSSQIDQAPNGRLGFLLLAMLPFAFTFFDRRYRVGVGLGAAGLLGFLAICLRTSYARYWFPMYPLMLIPLVVALGKVVSRAQWRLTRMRSTFAAVAIFAILLAALPIVAIERLGLPWQVYSKEISTDVWMSKAFAGFPAIEQVNDLLVPGDRIVVSGYESVYSLDAEAYTLPFWMLGFYSVNDSDSFRELLARKNIRYWVMDHSNMESVFFSSQVGGSVYWTHSRLVAAYSNVAVYDVSAPSRPSRYLRSGGLEVMPIILSGASTVTRDGAGWEDFRSDNPERSARVQSGRFTVPSGGIIAYNFSVPADIEMCITVIHRVRGVDAGVVVLSFEWFDENQSRVGRVGGHASYQRNERKVYFSGKIPQGARYGRLQLTPWQSEMLQLGEMSVDFLRLREGANSD